MLLLVAFEIRHGGIFIQHRRRNLECVADFGLAPLEELQNRQVFRVEGEREQIHLLVQNQNS